MKKQVHGQNFFTYRSGFARTMGSSVFRSIIITCTNRALHRIPCVGNSTVVLSYRRMSKRETSKRWRKREVVITASALFTVPLGKARTCGYSGGRIESNRPAAQDLGTQAKPHPVIYQHVQRHPAAPPRPAWYCLSSSGRHRVTDGAPSAVLGRLETVGV